MARTRANLRRLLVEGRDEKRLIPYLVEENGILWGETPADWIVDIVEFDGVENLLKPGTIEAELKSSNLNQLGILLDADENLAARWSAVRTRCIQAFPNLPNKLLQLMQQGKAVHHIMTRISIKPESTRGSLGKTRLEDNCTRR